MDSGAQTVRLLFDVPTRIRRIFLVFRELEIVRTHEFVLRWRSSADQNVREIVRQQ
jgi:hypothetical protein